MHNWCISIDNSQINWCYSVSSEVFDPLFHAKVVSVGRPPSVELVTLSARFKNDKGWEALNAIARGREPVLRAINLDELHLVAILSREFIHDFVPAWHEIDAVFTGWHEEVDDYNFIIASCLDQVLELVRVVSLCAFGLLPPVEVHAILEVVV